LQQEQVMLELRGDGSLVRSRSIWSPKVSSWHPVETENGSWTVEDRVVRCRLGAGKMVKECIVPVVPAGQLQLQDGKEMLFYTRQSGKW
jgi:hypothetical protein